MENIKTYSQLKTAARNHLSGKYGGVIANIFICQLIVSSVSYVGNSFLLGLPMPIQHVIFILLDMLCYFVQFGLSFTFLQVCCGAKADTYDLSRPFHFNPKRTLWISGLLTILNFICLLPANIVSVLPDIHYQMEWSLILLLVGELLFILVSLPFAFVNFLMIDFPERNAKEILRISIWLMKGHKLRYLFLMIRFVPLFILSFLSFGIGYLWCYPYFMTTTACFYLNLAEAKSSLTK